MKLNMKIFEKVHETNKGIIELYRKPSGLNNMRFHVRVLCDPKAGDSSSYGNMKRGQLTPLAPAFGTSASDPAARYTARSEHVKVTDR